MTERRIIYSAREAHDTPNQPIALKRLAQIYGIEELEDFLKFVKKLEKEEKNKFCVSRKDDARAMDCNLLFFEVNERVNGKFPQIVFLGQMMGKGSIEIQNRFAAETYGYSVLKLPEKKNK